MFSVLSQRLGILNIDQRGRDGFFWLQLQAPAGGDGGSSELDYGRPTRDQGRRRVAPKTTSWSPPSTVIAC